MYIWLATIVPAIYVGREIVHTYGCDGCNTTFWRRLRRDFWLARPGKKGDLARISRVRQIIRHFARMEREGTIVSAGDLNTLSRPFLCIANEGNYQAYEKNFIPSKISFWIDVVLFALWPVSIPFLMLYVLHRVCTD